MSGLSHRATTSSARAIAEFFKTEIGEVWVGGQCFKLYGSLSKTMAQVKENLGEQAIVTHYLKVSGDKRLTFSMWRARGIASHRVNMDWWKALGAYAEETDNEFAVQKWEEHGKSVPVRMIDVYHQAIKEALVAKKDETAEGGKERSKEPRVTIKAIIEAGLLGGKKDEAILAEVQKAKPGAKADESHIRYYEHFLVKAGKMDKRERPRAKKAKDEATEDAAGAKPKKGTQRSADALKETAKAQAAAPAKGKKGR